MKTYRQLRTTVQRLRRRNRTSGYQAISKPNDTQGEFEVFAGDVGRTTGTYQRCGSARQAGLLADHLASVNSTEMHCWHEASAPNKQLVYSVSPLEANVAQPLKQRNRKMSSLPRTVATTDYKLVSEISQQLDWKIYGALDLVLDLLDASGQQEAVSELMYQAEELEPDYQWTSAPHDLVTRVQDMVGQDVAQFSHDLLQDVNWSAMARVTREYFFGPDRQLYPAPYQAAKLAGHNQKEGSKMTQKRNRRRPSRNARRRLTARVERARTADDQGQRQDVRRGLATRRANTRPVNGRPSNRRPDAQRPDGRRPVSRRTARFQPTKAQRLTNRVASLTRLLRTAERELRQAGSRAGQATSGRGVPSRPTRREATRTAQPSLRTRRARVAAIRARLDREAATSRATSRTQIEPRPSSTTRRRTARPARQPSRRQASQARGEARSEARQQARTAEAPPVIRRKSDGKLYVRQD